MGDLVGQATGRRGVTSVALTVPNILSVAGSPITDAGTLAVTLATQNANLIFAGPSSGGAAAPTFRSLVEADIPTLTTQLGTAVILAPGSSARNVIQPSASTYIPLTLKGAASQSADLLELQNSSGTILSKCEADGTFHVNVVGTHGKMRMGALPGATDYGGIWVGSYVASADATNYSLLATTNGAGAVPYTIFNAPGSSGVMLFAQNNSYFMQIKGSRISISTSTGAVGDSASRLSILTESASKKALSLIGYTSQSVYLMDWQDSGGNTIGFIGASGSLYTGPLDSATNTVIDALSADHNSSSTPAAGFGTALLFYSKSSTTGSRKVARVRGEWNVATDASRAGDLVGSAFYTTTEQEGWRVRAASGAVKLSFFGATPVAKPAVTGSRAANAALADLLTQLVALGLITDSTSA